MLRSKPITGALRQLQQEIEAHAVAYGLDFFPQIFEICDYDTINILAAQGGFPSRYPHWRFGMDYDQLSKGYSYGLQKIYEMVVNTNPCYAYLLEANNWVDQKIVIAHVYAHNDFFKNNAWFANTDRRMMDQMANHGVKIRRYMEKYGVDRVETFIDKVLSLENLLDPQELFETLEIKRRREELEKQFFDEKGKNTNYNEQHSSEALRSYIRAKLQEEKKKELKKAKVELDQKEIKKRSSIEAPMRDVLLFLIENAPLEEWELDVLGILREEAYYYLPQRMTKIMNEGWASYWHSKIMTEKVMDGSEIIDFADKHSGVMAMSRTQINPYKIGIELFRDIEYRWDTGRFGKEYVECENMEVKASWNKKTMLGREKIFEVRRSHNDISFIDQFFTQEFCERQQLFTYKFNPKTNRYEIESREFEEIKAKLLAQLTNFGQPVIEVVDDNYQNRSELLLIHRHYGVDLDVNYASETLRNLFALWKRPVNLQTIVEEKGVVFKFDGKEFKQASL
jgi:stage V sporulation protein R